ncbi:PREDICTED: uncharacterized protein LOC109174778 [Ipomoea nil]|uniref:uncharacterized protein LOC109174778 n=1 Tax=Ipomoea nil TaxID=35883 RepID=UPI000901BD82|nr:PREDICTED: uncharacterized protein LOC109174778 [Ipomoea nil]
MRKRRFEIIDNSPVAGKNEDRYGAIPQELLDMLSAYLHNKRQGLRSAFVDNMRAIRMQMPWRDSKHKEDCGVYTMRHMEVYMGEKCKDWECGLQKGDRNELRKLRQRYLHDILLSEINGHREAIVVRTKAYIRRNK